MSTNEQQVIRVTSYVAVIFTIISVIVTIVVFHSSESLTADRKIYFSGILGVCTIGLLIVIFVSQKEPVALSIFSTLALYLSALTLGLSITYA